MFYSKISVRFVLVAMLLIVGGCVSGSKRVSRVASDPVVPEHEMREQFIGTWVDEDGEPNCVVKKLENGDIVVDEESNEYWESVVNNVRIEEGELCYDLYNYYVWTEDVSLKIPEAGIEINDHPYSGVRNEVRLSLDGDDANRMTMSASTEALSKPIKIELSKVNK
ncbi:MAG: hypothetical protein KDA65_12575 [Planctomycetaceae bacterium]|nr:hypothetical protein [Planctomycetaceae bacterium]